MLLGIYRTPGVVVLLLASCIFSACVRVDDSYARTQTVGGRAAAMTGEASLTEAGVTVQNRAVNYPARHSFLGLRRDDTPDPKRVARAGHLLEDSRTFPAPGEQRAARALALAELDIINRGGNIMYRSDGSSSQPQSVTFVASPSALTIDYRAAATLNHAAGVPHALQLVVYHLSDRAALDQLAMHTDGMRKLLAGEMFDASVKGVRKHMVQPNTANRLHIDRFEGGRFVAIVAGYTDPVAATSLYVTEYGVGQWKLTEETLLPSKKVMYSPLPLHLAVDLGPLDMSVKNTGRIYGNLQKVSYLLAEQTRNSARASAF